MLGAVSGCWWWCCRGKGQQGTAVLRCGPGHGPGRCWTENTGTRAGAHQLEMTISPWAVLKVSGHWSAREQPPRSPPTEPRPSHRTLIHQCPATRKGKPGPGQSVVCAVCCLYCLWPLYCLLSVLSVVTVLSRLKFKDVSQQVSHSPAPTPTLAHRHNLV